MADISWIVTNGKVAVRIMAENPQLAFERAARTMDPKGAYAHEVSYVEGVEHISQALYRYRDGGAAPVIADPKFSTFDENWHDLCPSTRPCATCDVVTSGAPRPEKCKAMMFDVECRPFVPAPLDMNKAVCIMGYGVSRPMVGEWKKKWPQAEIWTLNNDRMVGATRHFQIHDPAVCPDIGKSQWDMSDLETAGVQIYRHDNFPFDKVRRDYFCSTADYMMAIADLEGFGIICTPGLDFAGMRRTLEMHSMRYWIGIIEGKGGIVHRSTMSAMFRHLRYGFHTEKEHYEYELEPDGRSTPFARPAAPRS